MTAPMTTDPRIHRVRPSGRADEAWEEVAGPWLFERYGDAWCAIKRINQMRRPSPGNPFPTLDQAVRCALEEAS
ncbi:hypothetical protein ACIA5D_36660 [Actinoplanes sp. NPDC051513]|uniref:hypothetical protein n=1 Tax=Actinoplanes sp. NPDC051513 TaxID=3363908 RepID=UPI003799FA59